MNIVERIQNEYPLNYLVMEDKPTMSVCLRFHAEVPQGLQTRLVTVLRDRFALKLSEDAALPLTLEPDEKVDCYRLLGAEGVLYRFAARAPYTEAAQYDPVEAIAWVVYILSTATEAAWLSKFRDSYLSCRVFCARQQRIAADYYAFAENQYNSGRYPEKRYHEQCRSLIAYCKKLADKAPRYSCQPICETGFAYLRKGFLGLPIRDTVSLENLCLKLFGDQDFSEIIDAYCDHVQTTELYRNQLEKAKKKLVEDVRKVPIAAANTYLSELHHYISNLNPEPPLGFPKEEATPTRNPETLRAALAPLDKQWQKYAEMRICKAFLLQVQAAVDALMDEELKKANLVVQDARIALRQFSVLRTGSDQELNWQYLSEPENAKVYVPETDWNTESFSNLQWTLTDNEVWLCSDHLKKEMEQKNAFAHGMDRTYSIRLSNDQYVWAFWRS